MPSNRFSVNCAAYLALIKGNEIFLIKRANTAYKNGFWCMPSGHIEQDETPEQAAAREAKEEVGVHIDTNDISFATSQFRQTPSINSTYADYMFVANLWHGEPYNAEPNKASEGKWFNINNLPENIIEPQRVMISDFQNNTPYRSFTENDV